MKNIKSLLFGSIVFIGLLFLFVSQFSVGDITDNPLINFTLPTPPDGTSQLADSIPVNLSTTFGGDSYSFVDFDRSLVLWMRMNNESGEGESNSLVKDFSTWGNNGTPTGSPVWSNNGRFGGSYNYVSASSQYINVPTSTSLNPSTSSFTYALWFNSTSTATADIICKTDGTATSVTSGFRVLMAVSPNFLSVTVANGTNVYRWNYLNSACTGTSKWCHIAVVVDRALANMSVYINGTYVSSLAIMTGGAVSSNINLTLGGIATRYFNGQIDDVMMWNRTLSQAEISSLYSATVTQYYKNFTGLANGAHTMVGYGVNGTNYNTTGTRTITTGASGADTTPPSVTLISPTDNNITNLTSVTFNCSATDTVNLQNITLYGNWTGSFTANQSLDFSGTSNSSNFTAIIQNGTYRWNCYACDNSSNCAFASANRTFQVNTSYGSEPPDTIYPIFSTYWDNNGTILDSGLAKFNVTLQNTNGTVLLQINGANYSAKNLTASVYNVSVTLSGGVYSYYWISWGNGTAHNFNISNAQSYTVNQSPSTPPQISFVSPTPPNDTITANTSIIINISITDSNLTNVTYNWNGTNLTFFDSTLRLWFNFDNNSNFNESDGNGGLIHDLSLWHNNGNFTNSSSPTLAYRPKIGAGKFGTSAQFDPIDFQHGASMIVLHSESLNPQYNDFAMMFWFNCGYCSDSDISRKGNTVNAPNNYKMEMAGYGTANLISMTTVTSGGSGSTQEYATPVCQDNIWHFAIGQRVGNVQQLWVDGVLRGSGSITGYLNNTANLSIGSKDDEADDFFNGSIDDYRIYINRSFSQAEIQQMYMISFSQYNSNQYYLYVNQTRNATLLLANGTYTYQAFAVNGNNSALNSTDLRYITINTSYSGGGADTTPPYFTTIPATTRINYTQGFGVLFSATDETAFGTYAINWTTLFAINNSGWLTNSTKNIAVGAYYINVTINDSSNNLNSTVYLVNVSKATGEINGTINKTSSNFTSEYGSSSRNILLNLTNISGAGTGSISINGSIINSGNLPLSNLTNFSVGFYNVTFIYNGNSNYTSSQKILWVNISDTTPPSISLISPTAGTQDTDGSLSFIYTPTDISNISNCSLNYNDGSYLTASNIALNAQNQMDITNVVSGHPLYRDNLRWSISCTDIYGNTGISETRELDTKYDVSGGGTQAGGGADTTSNKNPMSISLAYPSEWAIGKNVSVEISVFNRNLSLYMPSNISFEFETDEFMLEEKSILDGKIITLFLVKEDASLGEKVMKLIVSDERRLESLLKFEVVERETESKATVLEELKRMSAWIIGGFVIVGIVIFLLVAIFWDKSRKRKDLYRQTTS